LKLLYVCLLITVSVVLSACNGPQNLAMQQSILINEHLSQKLSAKLNDKQTTARAAHLSNVGYPLDINLNSPRYFDASAKVKRFMINGHKIYPRYNGEYSPQALSIDQTQAQQGAIPQSTDFITRLSASSKLDNWHHQWLDSAGANSIQAIFSCNNNRVNTFFLYQFPSNTGVPMLRSQTVTIGLFTNGRSDFYLNNTLDVTYTGKRTQVDGLIGARCPDLVYPNYLDKAYVKVRLDKTSLTNVRHALNKVNDPKLRTMLWQSVWDSVNDGNLPLEQYLDIVFIHLPQEQDSAILEQVLASLGASQTLLKQMQPSHQRRYANNVLKALEQMSLRGVMTYHKQPQLQQSWFNAYIHLATSPAVLEHLQQIFAGTASIKGLKLTQAQRWHIIILLNRYDVEASDKLIAEEQHLDASDYAQRAALAARVSRPHAHIKRIWLARVEQKSGLSADKLAVVMAHLYPAEQRLLNIATAEQRLTTFIRLDGRRTSGFIQAYGSNLLPKLCNHGGVARLQKALNDNPQLSEVTRNALLLAQQSERRCVIIKTQLRLDQSRR